MALWPMIFTVGVYLSLLLCLYACVRIGMTEGWITGLLQFVMLAGFAVLHWLLESWAHVSAPFYDYPQNLFWDMIPNFDWSKFGFAPPLDPCAQAVTGGISATVPLSGAIICFCLLWTARLLLTTPVWLASYRPAIAPFMVALIAMLFDGYLDPVAAISVNCQPLPELLHAGLGFWTWHTEPRFADVWFSIPLFNFASWYAFPATVTAAALLLGWAANAIILGNPVAIFDGVLRLIILLALLTVAVTAPGAKPPVEAVAFIVGLIADQPVHRLARQGDVQDGQPVALGTRTADAVLSAVSARCAVLFRHLRSGRLVAACRCGVDAVCHLSGRRDQPLYEVVSAATLRSTTLQ